MNYLEWKLISQRNNCTLSFENPQAHTGRPEMHSIRTTWLSHSLERGKSAGGNHDDECERTARSHIFILLISFFAQFGILSTKRTWLNGRNSSTMNPGFGLRGKNRRSSFGLLTF